jgi:LytS/YehU family sensor histidine kinase
MLDHLIAYLRATLGASRQTQHALQNEFDRVRDYLEIMAVRMGPRLTFSLDLPQALAANPVPTLLLQPLVENAVLHGLEPKIEGGSIRVMARCSGGQLVLEVQDTGCGLHEDGASPSGFGLVQVRERLASHYGPQAALTLSSRHPPNKETGSVTASVTGTLAQITLPLHTNGPT